MTKHTIWVTGAEGRLGSELLKRIKENEEYKVIDTDKDVDITDMQAVDHAIDVYRPTVVINCASISDVEYCENNPVEAYRVNALGARNLAIAARRMNAKIIQMSTDDVFAGMTSGKYNEFDTPNPKTVYGKSKLAGENFVRELNPKHVIIRSSWVYGVAKGDYFTYVVNQAKAGKVLSVPVNVVSTPTSAHELAAFVDCLIGKNEYGLFHASCEGTCTRFEFAKTILELMELPTEMVQPMEEKEASSTLLDNLMIKMTGFYAMSDWMSDMKGYVERLKNNQ